MRQKPLWKSWAYRRGIVAGLKSTDRELEDTRYVWARCHPVLYKSRDAWMAGSELGARIRWAGFFTVAIGTVVALAALVATL